MAIFAMEMASKIPQDIYLYHFASFSKFFQRSVIESPIVLPVS